MQGVAPEDPGESFRRGYERAAIERAHLFGGPERVRRAKKRTEQAQLLTASARERAMELARKYEGFPRTEAQRRRLAKLQAL
jgi:hypothetical protein